MKKRTVLFLAQAVVSIIILSYIFRSIPLAEIWSNLPMQKLGWLVAAGLVALCLIQIAAGFRWKNILHLAGLKEKLSTLIKINFTSLFLGLMLPSSDGYAAIRLLLLEKKHPERRGLPSGSVIIEKLLGMIILGIFGFIFSLWLQPVKIILMARCCYLILIIIGIALMLILSSPKVLDTTLRFLEKRGWNKLSGYLSQMQAGNVKIQSKKLFIKVLPLVILVQGLVILIPIFILKSMNIGVPLYAHFALIPISQIITLLPVTFNGLGLREGSFVMLYKMFGLEPSQAITLSLQYFALLILLPAIAGGLVMWTDTLILAKRRFNDDSK